jgi:methylenetetrahydrofolate reductase (NADPH)
MAAENVSTERRVQIMKIDRILSEKKTLSFEVFPPKKSDTETEQLFRTIDKLKALHPDFISVTYGAGGTNGRNAAEIAGYIKHAGMEPLAHLTGGPSTPEDVDRMAAAFRAAGVENILALRGDKPQDMDIPYCKYFLHASDLATYLQKYDFTIGAACYPEGHTECETLYADLENMKRKEACGAKFFITQIFYDNSYYYRLVHEARRIGITAPIIPGIMPLTNARNIRRIKTMCGSTIPLEFRNMLEVYSSTPAVMEEIGLNYAVYQIIDLIAKGAPGIHLYIMNNAHTAEAIYARLENVFHELFTSQN